MDLTRLVVGGLSNNGNGFEDRIPSTLSAISEGYSLKKYRERC